MMKLKVVVTGATGRMGAELIRYAHENDDCELFGATERHDHPMISQDVGKLMLGEPNGLSLENDLRNVIVGTNAIIDFTSPDSTLIHLQVAVDHKIPIVIGSTGFDNEQKKILHELAPQTRTVFSPNMSMGVNLMWKIAQQMAVALGDEFDAEIVEAHHRKKEDAPSGTALQLAQRVAAGWEKEAADLIDNGRQGQIGPREYGRIGMHAVRGGDIVGEHTLSFFGPGEEIRIAHRATSRLNFVKGAFRAALFLQSAPDGLYDMMDVLKL